MAEPGEQAALEEGPAEDVAGSSAVAKLIQLTSVYTEEKNHVGKIKQRRKVALA